MFGCRRPGPERLAAPPQQVLGGTSTPRTLPRTPGSGRPGVGEAIAGPCDRCPAAAAVRVQLPWLGSEQPHDVEAAVAIVGSSTKVDLLTVAAALEPDTDCLPGHVQVRTSARGLRAAPAGHTRGRPGFGSPRLNPTSFAWHRREGPSLCRDLGRASATVSDMRRLPCQRPRGRRCRQAGYDVVASVSGRPPAFGAS